MAANKSLGALAVSRILSAKARVQAAGSISIRLADLSPLAHLPSNFIGLGYEMSSAAPTNLLSAKNDRYVRLIGNLGKNGILRIGGILADFTHYEPDGQIVAEPENTVITRASLEQLNAFLKEVGWTAIWSVNFGRGTLEEAVAEARDVVTILGSRLEALELGNEVENYSRGKYPLRRAPYSYETYRSEYSIWHEAIAKAVPRVRFAAPDTAGSVEWVEKMARDGRRDVQLLTTHYYRNDQQKGSAEQLAMPDPVLKGKLERLEEAARQSGIPWRMCETNSFSGGGRPGISDTMLGALWTLDYMLLLAQYGCAGVNIETGVNQLGFISSYSPIQDDGSANNTAGAPYYGMLACSTAIAGSPEMLSILFDVPSPGMTAYALGAAGKPRALVVVNRDDSQKAEVSFAALNMGAVHAMRLSAPSGSSKTQITFAGAAVNPDGSWKAASAETLQNGRVTVPPMSAVVLLKSGAGVVA